MFLVDDSSEASISVFGRDSFGKFYKKEFFVGDSAEYYFDGRYIHIGKINTITKEFISIIDGSGVYIISTKEFAKQNKSFNLEEAEHFNLVQSFDIESHLIETEYFIP